MKVRPSWFELQSVFTKTIEKVEGAAGSPKLSLVADWKKSERTTLPALDSISNVQITSLSLRPANESTPTTNVACKTNKLDCHYQIYISKRQWPYRPCACCKGRWTWLCRNRWSTRNHRRHCGDPARHESQAKECRHNRTRCHPNHASYRCSQARNTAQENK